MRQHARFCSGVVVQVAVVLKWHEVRAGGSNGTERSQGNRCSTKLRKGLGTEITTELGPKLLNPHCEINWFLFQLQRRCEKNSGCSSKRCRLLQTPAVAKIQHRNVLCGDWNTIRADYSCEEVIVNMPCRRPREVCLEEAMGKTKKGCMRVARRI